MCRVIEGVMVFLLVWMSYCDWKTKEIPNYLLLATFVIAMISRIFLPLASFWGTVVGVIIGILFCGISRWTCESIGYGDSWLILSLGICYGGRMVAEILFISGFLASIYSICYCMRHGWNRKYSLPYIPFIAVAYIGRVFL